MCVHLGFEVVSYVKYLTGTTQESLQGVEYKYFQCFQDSKGVFNLSASLCILVFQMVIQPCFYRCMPTMLKRIQIGLLFCLLGTVSYASIDLTVSLSGAHNSTVCYLNPSVVYHATGVDYHWALLPDIVNGIGFGLGTSVMFELTIAQSPGPMRGLVVGIWYSVFGIALLCSFLLYKPFSHINSSSLPLTCTFFYQITKSTIAALVLIVFIVLSKWYKLRIREEIVDIHNIVAEIYNKNLTKEGEHHQNTLKH